MSIDVIPQRYDRVTRFRAFPDVRRLQVTVRHRVTVRLRVASRPGHHDESGHDPRPHPGRNSLPVVRPTGPGRAGRSGGGGAGVDILTRRRARFLRDSEKGPPYCHRGSGDSDPGCRRARLGPRILARDSPGDSI